jgi:hypothetical protein
LALHGLLKREESIMPCYDSRNEPDNIRAEAKRDFQADLDKLTRMLCRACAVIEKKANALELSMGAELSEWWERHKRLDKKRRR